MKRLFCVALGLLLSVTLATSSAWATAFTLAAPIIIDASWAGNPASGGLVLGTINPVTDITGLILPVPNRDGNIGFVTNDVFVVDLTLSAGSASVDELGMTVGIPIPALFSNPVGAGAFDDAGDQAPTSVTASLVLLAGLFDFSGNTVDAGETTVRLFVTINPLGEIAAGQTVNFMVSSGTDFTVQGTIAEVPLPATLALLATGLAGVAFRQRRRVGER